MYLIGLIDDEPNELTKIRRAIKENAPKTLEYNFKSYSLDDEVSSLIQSISEEIVEDIKENRITGLIVDYRIIIKSITIEGSDIFKRIHELIPEFPVIILTDVISDCIKHDFIDPDKVYKKSEFFKLEEKYSKDKTENIFRNMERYVIRRESLQIQLDQLKNEIGQKGMNQDIFDNIIAVENKLDDFYPIEQSQVEKVLDSNKLKEVVDLLSKAEDILEK
ncbi:hypothetical protein BCD91_005143 [Clostridium beijerinckii]|uniref:hypothetical protein n=1 Tax=Clostridium beijerinckii TaxID=1520 RepID=UPI001494E8AB|nr:hypothetical protein [Clostridium beijerinckii]NOW93120.1 hypothetical protein [Clostridium beijerinckii]